MGGRKLFLSGEDPEIKVPHSWSIRFRLAAHSVQAVTCPGESLGKQILSAFS